MTAGGTAIDRRRSKAALFLACCALAGIAPHALSPLRGLLPAITLALFLGGYSIRTVWLTRAPAPGPPVAPDDLPRV
ncbi:MAG: glycosyltransferase family 2 protein, partial [Cyanobacteriota bacterium]